MLLSLLALLLVGVTPKLPRNKPSENRPFSLKILTPLLVGVIRMLRKNISPEKPFFL